MNTRQTSTSYTGPFLTMVFLFFIVGFLTTANTQFQAPLKTAFLSQVGEMKNTLTTLITFFWFLAYPAFGGVGSRWVNAYGYKGTLVRGLLVMVVGLGLFWSSAYLTANYPAANLIVGESIIPYGFFVFLLGGFVAGGSATILQVIINPYLSACHVSHTQPVQRMAIGGTANSIGTTFAPYFVSGIVFSHTALDDVQVSQLMLPFAALLLIMLALSAGVKYATLPDIEGTRAEEGEQLERSVWSFSHLRWGVVSIFFYVGCEVCIGGNINLYALDQLGYSEQTITLMATLYWAGLLVGRLCATTLSSVSPRTQLTVTTSLAILLMLAAILVNNPWLLVAVGLCHSIMWGCIFTLAVAQLGKYTSVASGVFMIGVVGGAILPLLQGFLADFAGWRLSWLLVLLGECVMFWYARWGSRLRQQELE